MSAEPTAEQMELAKQLYRQAHDADDHPEPWLATLAIARALAAAVTAEQEKSDTRVALALQQQQRAYETVAKEVEARMKATEMALVSGDWAARRIREVSR